MERTAQYRMRLRLLDYAPSKRERYLLRVTIETTELFASLPYQLVVEHATSGSFVTFHIRGLAVQNTLPAIPQSASYVRDIIVERDGEVTIAVTRSSTVQSFSLLFDRGSMRLAEQPPIHFIEILIDNSTEG